MSNQSAMVQNVLRREYQIICKRHKMCSLCQLTA